MRKTHFLLPILLVVLAIGAITGGFTRTNASATSLQSANSASSNVPVQKPLLRAIPLRWLNATPAFTLDDVKQELQTHTFRGGPTLSGGQPAIEAITWMTMKEVAARLAMLTGHIVLPGAFPNREVCYVQLRGPFSLTMEHNAGGSIPTVARGFEVIDAHTGQLFEWGALPA